MDSTGALINTFKFNRFGVKVSPYQEPRMKAPGWVSQAPLCPHRLGGKWKLCGVIACCVFAVIFFTGSFSIDFNRSFNRKIKEDDGNNGQEAFGVYPKDNANQEETDEYYKYPKYFS